MLKDSGTRETFETGAMRDAAEDKGAFDLLSACYHSLWCVAVVFEKGAKKYAARNWEKGIPTRNFYSSAVRHLLKWGAGWRDEDHLAQACWNILCLIETRYRIKCGILPVELETMPDGHPLYGENKGVLCG